MKLLVVGDVHGSEIPLKIIEKHGASVDKIVCTGDYVDSRYNTWVQQKEVLSKLLELRQGKFKNKLTLLFGNHDISYLTGRRCSGHQTEYEDDIRLFFEANYFAFDILFESKSYLVSHAGLTESWMLSPLGFDKNKKPLSVLNWKIEDVTKAFRNKQFEYFLHNSDSPTGNSVTEGCLWVRPFSLVQDAILGYTQIVGHTEVGHADNHWGIQSRIFTKNDFVNLWRHKDCQIKNGREAEDLKNKFIYVDSKEKNVFFIVDTDKENELLVSALK